MEFGEKIQKLRNHKHQQLLLVLKQAIGKNVHSYNVPIFAI